ncbi:MAG: DUF1343 domain-containing protein [Balneolaceae bacterium]|nr:DUF1343 domain-containing protein [Balneolaceae bacterium]MCH8547250.1 DUF1343 domain-containing protein [Balneolaceae bacterium]
MSLKPFLLLTSILCFSILFAVGCDLPNEERDDSPQITLGAEKLIENHLQELDGERIGLVMNPTARIGEAHMLDSLLSLDVNITALFAPEHGFRGEAGAGDRIEDGIDQASGLPVFSLYGDTRKPTPEMLDEVDMLIFDMQDVGARFYTYIATLGLVLEAASESGTPVWVLDRPNPMGGDYVSGWMMDMEYESFVGPYPIPIAHGLTMGEIARMIVGEEWMDFEDEPDLRVIEMEGWSRDMIWPDTGLSWVAPSPNLPTFDHTYMYMGTVYYEGTTMSEGRGTDDPFLVIGDPGTDLSDDDFEQLNRLDGISISPYTFTPRSIPGVAPNPKHLDTQSFGIRIELESHDFDPIRTGLEIFRIVMNATPSAETNSFLYRLTGSDEIEQVLAGEVDPMTLDFGLDGFISDREPYLLYD